MSIGHLGLPVARTAASTPANAARHIGAEFSTQSAATNQTLAHDKLCNDKRSDSHANVDVRELPSDVQGLILARVLQERRLPILQALSDRQAVQSYVLTFAYARHTKPLAIYFNHEAPKREIPRACIQWALQRMLGRPVKDFTPGTTRMVPRKSTLGGGSVPAPHLGVADARLSYLMTQADEAADLPCNADLRNAEVRRAGNVEGAALLQTHYGVSARVEGEHLYIPYLEYRRMANGFVGPALQIDVPAGASLRPIETFAADVCQRARQLHDGSDLDYAYVQISRNDPARRVLTQSPNESLGIRQRTIKATGNIRYKNFGWNDGIGETVFTGNEPTQIRVRKDVPNQTIIVSDWVSDPVAS